MFIQPCRLQEPEVCADPLHPSLLCLLRWVNFSKVLPGSASKSLLSQENICGRLQICATVDNYSALWIISLAIGAIAGDNTPRALKLWLSFRKEPRLRLGTVRP